MGNFFGTYERTLDSKHRLQIPSKLVKEMPTRFYSVKGHEGCLAVFEESAYNAFLETLKQRSFLDRDVRAYVRQVTSSTCLLDVDSHGRITLGGDLSEAYGFASDIIIIGVIDHFEIWSKENYAKSVESYDEGYDDLAQAISARQGQ